MKNKLKRLIAIVLSLALLSGFSASTSVVVAADASSVGSLWDGFTSGSGTFTVTSTSRVFVVGSSTPTGDLLQTAQLIQRELRAQFDESYFKDMVWGEASWAKTGDIVLKLDTTSGTGADGYKLNVTATTATVTAADVDGLIYGSNNLIKCFRAVNGKSISGFSGYDSPDTKERTVHLDVARKYYTVEWICNFIRQMSWMGYNALELHTSEDGGFRADLWDSEYYTGSYQPENDFSWLCGSHIQYWVYSPYNSDPDAGKYLTTEELVQICEVAKEYHIEIIPSFDSPAHMDYITWKFEQNYKSNTSYSFTYNGTTYKASSTTGCINYKGYTGGSAPGSSYTTIELNDDIKRGQMAKAFVFALYEDMADFFKEYAGSTHFMIGADEVGLSSSTWGYSDFVTYVNELNSKLNAKGYTVRMYNDFIGSTTYNQSNSKAVYDFADNIEICYWNSDYQPTNGSFSENIWHVAFFWHDGTDHDEVVSSWPSSGWGDGGRTLYNCIQTNTYYVLRYAHNKTNADARDPDNRQWTFYGTNEKDIYNKWYPANISEQGVYSENAADVPEEHLGGAYFLIWNDYAAMNTESQVWNGAVDAYDGSRTYHLFDIMASNIMKMWNADVNSTVTYAKFAEVRDATLEWFPGYTSCSADAYLPAATAPVQAYAADHSALEAALAGKISNADGKYTADSYATYESAYAAAQKVNADHAATTAEITTAINALNAAKNALAEKPVVDKTALQTAVDDAIPQQGSYTDDTWEAYQSALAAAKTVLNNENATQSDVNDALGKLNAAKDALKEIVNKDALQTAVDKAITEQGNYTNYSWQTYQDALAEAKAVLNDEDATQKMVDEAWSGLNTAESALREATDSDVEIISIRKISKTTSVGKKVGLVIVTSTNASEVALALDGKDVTLDLNVHNKQTLSGEEVCVWMINFAADEAGDFTYTLIVNGISLENVTVTVE